MTIFIHSAQDIDLSLPITSTYLRRMRAFGLGFDSPYQNHHHHHGLGVSFINANIKICTHGTLRKLSKISEIL